ncbi:MAG: hypothetical protein ABH839_00975 [Chloroflexota bacterium]
MEDNLIKKLMTSIKCDVCGHCYGADDITVINRERDLWFLKAACSSCHTNCVVAVVIKEDRIPEAISDSVPTQPHPSRPSTPLTDNDQLDMHLFLRDFDGDFARLFSH